MFPLSVRHTRLKKRGTLVPALRVPTCIDDGEPSQRHRLRVGDA
jgi:hypothetical protein